MAFLYPWKGSSVAIWIPERNCSPRSASQFSCTVPDLPGTRSNKRAVGWFFPRVRSTMPVSSRGPRRRRSWWCHTCSSTPSTRTPAKRAGSSDAACRHGLMWDHTVFHVVASCRARPAIVAPSKRSCRIAQQIARAPRRAPGCAHPLVMFQECHRLAGGFSAYPSPYCATGSLPESRPRARRSPPPPYDRGLERFTPQPGHPASWLHDSTSSTRASGVRATLIRWKPSKPTSRSHRSQRSSDTEQQQVG